MLAGIDGCKGGWFAAVDVGATVTFEVFQTIEVLMQQVQPVVAAIDIPIGVPDRAEPGGRACEREARRLLGSRRSSVFSTACWAALKADSYKSAVEIQRAKSVQGGGLPKQAFAIFPKIYEVNSFMIKNQTAPLYEVHPEVCFTYMNEGNPAAFAKKDPRGFQERIALLHKGGLSDAAERVLQNLPRGVGVDDALDALAAVWTARRIAAGDAVTLPASPPRDERGLLMAMWA